MDLSSSGALVIDIDTAGEKTTLSAKGTIEGASGFRDAVANYLSCDPSGAGSGRTTIDLFGLNNYEWCNDAPTTTYNGLNSEFENYNVLAYFNSVTVRPWYGTYTV
ncbi:hypothetical protein C8R45DRAFT_1159337 [Mycena sanguinolenta]|nr:hypothetical protein C8R45DRAFT_1159337 [Mycena sanguinolenta]